MGALYSRNIGILNAKGKYIMNLDNDDLFMDSEVFTDIYNEAQETNFDIIGFRAIEANNYENILFSYNTAVKVTVIICVKVLNNFLLTKVCRYTFTTGFVSSLEFSFQI